MDRKDQVYVLILVGGKGKRLRPLSSDSRPKAFLSITKDRKTMFRRTIGRAKKLVKCSNILVSANGAHSGLVKKDFPDIDRDNLILEPVSRNTAPAIALAAAILRERAEDPVMVVLPTDQYIINEAKYTGSLKRAIKFLSRERNAIIVLGTKPSRAATELGYIKVRGLARKAGGAGIYKVERFVEKPGAGTARRYANSKDYLWNMGAFVFKAGPFLGAIKELSPQIDKYLKGLDMVRRNYKKMPDISVDYAIMEKAKNIYCVKCACGWLDMGSFSNIIKILKRESRSILYKGATPVAVV